MPTLNIKTILFLICTTSLIAGCGEKDQQKSEANKANTQVVAKVNGDEISIHQVNFQLGRLSQSNQAQLNEAQSKEAAKQILARLVDQQLLKQKALEMKLDREPNVLQAIEASKSEILAQAYLEQLMTKAAKPSTEKVDTFYQENPELFEKRRVFRLQELIVEIDPSKHAEVESSIKNLKSINEIATWLKTNNYPFSANSNVRAAEQLPLGVLKKIQPLKDGEFVALPSGRSLNIVHLAASQSKPISRDKAGPIIEQYFINQNKASLAKTEMAALNDKAKVEFVGAFADMKKNKSTETSGDVSKIGAVSESPSQASAASEKSVQMTKPTADESNMDKGLSGL